MATATDNTAATAKQQELEAEALRRKNEETVAKFLSNNDYRDIAYSIEWIAGNIPEPFATLLRAVFELQDDFENETKFRAELLPQAVKQVGRTMARARIAEFERKCTDWRKEHKTVVISQEQVEQEVKTATRAGRRMHEMVQAAEKFLAANK